MSVVTVAAVDLGASSGRVMLARVGIAPDGEPVLGLTEVHRFGNGPVRVHQGERVGLHWDVVGLYREVLTGLRLAGERLGEGERLASIGIDSWAVDHGFLDSSGGLLGLPHCYRDERTAAAVERVHAVVGPEELYARNGLQFLPFTTVYQLAAEPPGRLAAARRMLLLPDLLGYWLTGRARAEVTNASTTGLLDVRTGEWSQDLPERLGLPAGLLPPLIRPGETLGALLPHVAAETGLPTGTPVVAVGSHDTASAVVGVPAEGDRFGYVSAGTWSLVGVELGEPVLTEASRAANFTNEGGVDDRIRFLRNVMGLWLLSESLRDWGLAGSTGDLEALLAAAADLPRGGPVFDPDDAAFLPPGDMPVRIRDALRGAGESVPAGRPALVRSILDSLATAHARALDDAVRLTGQELEAVHVVGGGSHNGLLCRLTARATGLPVLAGPVEATALGNALVQARAAGVVGGDVTALRRLLRGGPSGAAPHLRFEPDGPWWHGVRHAGTG